MELVEGLITNTELAAWFGIKPSSLKAHKAQKLEELSKYADFEISGTKILIKKVFANTYIKKRSKSYIMVKEEFPKAWNENHIDTAMNVSKKIEKKKKKELEVTVDTLYRYVLEVRNESYGKPFMGRGSKGTCSYVWTKKIADGKYEKFNEEEQKIYKLLLAKYFKSADEKQVFVADMIERGEITKEEAWTVFSEMTGVTPHGFLDFKAELEEAIGYTIVKATELQDELVFE